MDGPPMDGPAPAPAALGPAAAWAVAHFITHVSAASAKTTLAGLRRAIEADGGGPAHTSLVVASPFGLVAVLVFPREYIGAFSAICTEHGARLSRQTLTTRAPAGGVVFVLDVNSVAVRLVGAAPAEEDTYLVVAAPRLRGRPPGEAQAVRSGRDRGHKRRVGRAQGRSRGASSVPSSSSEGPSSDATGAHEGRKPAAS
jgi:hypothetical protein